uniref:Uncharacterized protein n=1 Tax=Candidatus Kentrum sp. DK TaxID=2126562 RepID=A0A450T397_9GAMM|nr:MAG: hypothetical protein BECKDK2373C_GA0170839_101718 [Candidatus Kentron sp. DK]VFJ61031.1 MAG: hypothetical protein BECKDK2373B_GA0170837_109715 [Candidatus Kentron sp. DK]
MIVSVTSRDFFGRFLRTELLGLFAYPLTNKGNLPTSRLSGRTKLLLSRMIRAFPARSHLALP